MLDFAGRYNGPFIDPHGNVYVFLLNDYGQMTHAMKCEDMADSWKEINLEQGFQAIGGDVHHDRSGATIFVWSGRNHPLT